MCVFVAAILAILYTNTDFFNNSTDWLSSRSANNYLNLNFHSYILFTASNKIIFHSSSKMFQLRKHVPE